MQRLGADVAERDPHLTYDARVVYGGEAAQRRRQATVIPWSRIHDHDW